MKPFDSEFKFDSGSEKVIFIEIQQSDRELSVFPIIRKTINLKKKIENYDLVKSTPVPKLSIQENTQFGLKSFCCCQPTLAADTQESRARARRILYNNRYLYVLLPNIVK
jgi:hypothetical protein